MTTIFSRLKKNKLAVFGLVFIGLMLGAALFADIISPYDPNSIVSDQIIGPSRSHLLGTDDIGRDILSRIIHGARISLSIGFVA